MQLNGIGGSNFMIVVAKNIENLLKCHFGGSPGTPPPVAKPPSPTQAATNVNDQKRKKTGFQSTLLSGPGGVTNQTTSKTILGG